MVGEKGLKEKKIFCDTRKLYEIQVSGPVNAVLLEHRQAWLHAVCGHFDPMMTYEVFEMFIYTPRVLSQTVSMIPHLFAPGKDWG